MKDASNAPLVFLVDELTESILTALDKGVSYAEIERAIQGWCKHRPSEQSSLRPSDRVGEARSTRRCW